MKKTYLLLILSFTIFLSYAQDKYAVQISIPLIKELDKFGNEGIIKKQGQNALNLYKISKRYLILKNGDKDFLIDSTAIELVDEMYFDVYTKVETKSLGRTQTSPIRHKFVCNVKLKYKDNKMKYELTDIRFVGTLTGQIIENGGTAKELSNEISNESNSNLPTLEEYINSLSSSTSRIMKKINYNVLSNFNNDFTKTWNKLFNDFQSDVLLIEDDNDW